MIMSHLNCKYRHDQKRETATLVLRFLCSFVQLQLLGKGDKSFQKELIFPNYHSAMVSKVNKTLLS